MEEKIVELFKVAHSLEKSQDNYCITIIYSSFEETLLTVALHSKLDLSLQQRCEIPLDNEPIAKIDALIRTLKIIMGGVSNE